jgi:uncharacterized protein (DUF302 family)
MRQLLPILISFLLFVSSTYADNGIVSVKSSYTVKETADRLENELMQKGMTVFVRINHAEGAKKVEQDLRPTELIIFGNPKVGTPLMNCNQTVGIDLPQKALIWEDKTGHVWLSYNDPQYLAKRHGLLKCTEVLKKVENALGNFAKAATLP